MQLRDFMHYQRLAFRVSMMRAFEWKNSGLPCIHQTRLQRLFSWLAVIAMAYQNVGMALFLFMAEQKDKDFSEYVTEVIETCAVMGLAVVSLFNMDMLLRKRADIEWTLSQLEELYCHIQQGSESQNYRIAHYYEKSTRLMKYTCNIFIAANIIYNTLPISDLLYDILTNAERFRFKTQTNGVHPWEFVADPRSPCCFLLTYLFQLFASIVGEAFMLSSQFMFCFFVAQLQLHFDGLAGSLQTLDASQPGAHAKLKSLFQYHCRLMRITDQINHIFKLTVVVNFAAFTISICMMGLSAFMINLVAACKYSVGMMTFLIFALFICYNGTKFTVANSKLLPAAFYNNWYEGDLAYRKMILFFMMSTTEPVVLKAYNYIPVSLYTFMSMLKFSYELFTFMSAII